MPRTSAPKRSTHGASKGPRPGSAHDNRPTAHISPSGGSRKGATQARARETVDAILEAAACILERDGYRAASTNAIARRAGVSIGSLYQYFASREDVFLALQERHRSAIHPLIARALERLQSEEDHPSTILSDLLGELVAAHTERPVLMHAIEVELARVLPPKAMLEEAGEVEAAARLLASRIRRPAKDALASAWLAAEITAMVSRRLAHDPPGWVEARRVQAAFARMMDALVGDPDS